MTRPAFIILLATLSLVVIAGCGRSHRYDSRLVLADSLMQANPDSALALVQAVDADSLSTEGDRAYHDLLLTQARYKCYITATSDSAINRALAYYRHHKGEREKLTRAYIYKGAVMEELNHPDSAMHYYKTAEASAPLNDYFIRGLCNLRIGALYQSHNVADSLVILRMRNALDCFVACRDTNYIMISKSALGSYMNKIDKDSATLLLNQALILARMIQSPEQFSYQSKLAGIYFYQQDYKQAKELAMDIINYGRDICYENMFYYYAARSFIKLGNIDSAYWVTSIIPDPVLAQDSFNYYLLQAELAEARHDNIDYNKYSAYAERIHRRIIDNPSKEKLLTTELELDASLQQEELESEYNAKIIWIVVLVLIALAAIIVGARIILRRKDRRYQDELEIAQQEIKRMVDESERQISELLAQRENDRTQIKRINKEKQQLEKQQESINRQAARITKYRNAALNELYLCIKIKKTSDNEKNRYLPLMETLKDLWEKRNILRMTPSKSFWDNLKLSVEGEYPGIVSFVEKNYPNLSSRDMQLFLLMCAGFPNQIINICMNYTGDATASKRKAILLKEKMGLNIKMDQFIELFINGEMGKE
jgi:hypothetical protein